MAEPSRGLSGLTDEEAKEFQSGFITVFVFYVAVALIAHVLTWMWRPWFAGPEGYQELGAVQTVVENVVTMLA